MSKPNNAELEIDFRITCSDYQTNYSLDDPELIQAYQDYLNAYQQKTSLYNVCYQRLFIYNTETEAKEVKTLQAAERIDPTTCITQLPNGSLFFFGNFELSGITVLIDLYDRVEVLPSGIPCKFSSCIYFNNSVYCFGGQDNRNYLNLSVRFDLDRNQWIQLTPMPIDDFLCNNIIFNGHILISGYFCRKLWRYSIDNDSFLAIPYKFAARKRKILINVERLYLIECPYGSIYESEIGSDMNWRWVAKSIIKYSPAQMHALYNKEGIYICCLKIENNNLPIAEYYKFDLNRKLISNIF